MPRIVTKTLYQYGELSDSAKARARDWFRSGDSWDSSDWWASAKAFEKIAPIRITSADYDRAQVGYTWAEEESLGYLCGVRAWKWLTNNDWFTWAAKAKSGECPMTGFCGDGGFGDAIMEYARKPGRVPDLKQVFYEAAQAWVQEARSDMEGASEDDYVGETIAANEYEFDDEGNRA